LIPVLIIAIAGYIVAQKKTVFNYDEQWKKIDQLAEKQLPESALKEVQLIIDRATKEKNNQQLIKATIFKMRFTLDRNPDKAEELIRNFESLAASTPQTVDKCLLYSMTADLYFQYYNAQRYIIDRRTEITGTMPEKMSEWTKNIFYDKISALLELSLLNKTELQQTPARDYSDLMTDGDKTYSFQPTMFDFLAHRKIELLNMISFVSDNQDFLKVNNSFLPFDRFAALKTDTANLSIREKVLKTYRDLITFHINDKSPEVLIYIDLKRLEYLNGQTADGTAYINALETLKQKFAQNEYVVEVLAKQAEYFFSDTDNPLNKRKALEICQNGIKQFPQYKRIGLLKNILQMIHQKNLIISHNDVVKPETDLKVSVASSNISRISVNIFKVNATALQYALYKSDYQNNGKAYPKRTLLRSMTENVNYDKNFGSTDTTLNIKSDSYGIYEIEITDADKKTEPSLTSFVVSDLGYMNRSTEAQMQNMYVLDRKSGAPMANVQVSAYEQRWEGNKYDYSQKEVTATDKTGACSIHFPRNYTNYKLFFERGADRYFSNNSYPTYFDLNGSSNDNLSINIFTDRSLYRPGQTVYFKGIAYYADKSRNETANHSKVGVTLRNANQQVVSTKNFETNEYGSFAGEFSLPQDGLNGAFTIETPNGSVNIYVEEYKRPTFEVVINKPKEELRFGDKVVMKGNVKAYAGYQVENANVNYRVTRTPHRYCWWWNEPEKEIARNVTKTDNDGNFEITFTPESPLQTKNSWRGSYYTYTVRAEVTDLKGETQQGEQSLSIGDKSLFIIADIPSKIEKTSGVNFGIRTETVNGENVNSEIKYEVYRLNESNDYIENQTEKESGKMAEKVATGIYQTSQNKLKFNYDKWKSGQYKIVLTTKDKFGSVVKAENTFIVYGNDDKRPPVKTYVWKLTPKTECVPGEKALIRFGTSTENTMVLYEIMQANRVIESKWVRFDNEIKDFEIPFKEEYGSGVNVFFTFMKDEKIFSEKTVISLKKESKTITPALSVFRNKLLPGEKAEWTISIPEMKNQNRAAEVLVTMYDASLDAIRNHSWNFNPVYQEGVMYSPEWRTDMNQRSYGNINFYEQGIDIPDFQQQTLNWFGLVINGIHPKRERMLIRGMSLMKSGTQVVDEEVTASVSQVGAVSDVKANTLNEVVQFGKSSADALSAYGGEPVSKPKQVNPRTNFNETAFFYPQLRTDKNGNVKFSFTAPESLTRWNIKMLAHTPDLFSGQFDTTAITQKDLMVQMNLPRFVRRSDKLTLSANVVNLSGQALTAQVTFEMTDPATEKVIQTETKTIILDENEGSKAVRFDTQSFAAYDLLVCKVTAQAGNFSDGEQKYLPVLPDKVLITESLPLIIRNNQTREFRFESLMKNITNVDTKNLSVEFSSNPAWYAVQALPTLSSPDENNALSLFTAYYANSLAGYIANSNPKIARIFDQWKNVKSSRDALISNLGKNNELKNMLLEETPWVMAAQNETEQKQRIALLFDLNNQKNQAQQYLDKLLKLQTASGGFSWYAEMPENRYITQEIMLNLARLHNMTGQKTIDAAQQTAIENAWNYLDLEISKDFKLLKKNNKDYLKQNCISNMQLFYLHARSEYPDIPVPAFAAEAVKYYTAQSEKYWTSFSLYGKAMMAVVAWRNGKTKVVGEIMKSIKENALKTDEMGMYWAKNLSGYFWNERPVAVQAAIIEAFTETSQNPAEIDELRIWLLKQKQTQRWDSPVATVDAIYALLLRGSDWLNNDNKTEITVGNTTLNPARAEAGTGYFKVSLPATEINANSGKIKVSSVAKATSANMAQTGSGIGWGAMYWQYYQEQSKVQNSGGALSISKSLFVKNGSSMTPANQVELKKGDRVVTRLVVTTDRNLEFVALKDLRAACFEPVEQRSGSAWKEGVCYYQTSKDASTQFFFSYLPKGTYVFEYEVWVNNSGVFTSGISSIQCLYAPEFVSYAGGEKINVK
jgi:uncharacterized protein YfaS (alpha-2-macroglobulin family)